jgi:serine/threonine protein kinase
MWRRGIEYKIQELLGEGGQGSVYKVLRRDRATGLSHTVAAKILHSKNAVDVWRREFESLARVRSPYCVQVHAFERLNGRPALILEYVEGVSLLQLARAGVLSASDTREISAQLESALLDLNSSGLFHGDLSPANVLVDIEGRIRLLDFGLANCTGDAGLRRLTPEFAAPERLQGARAGLASDLFSLGRIENFLLGRKSSLDIHSPYLNVMPEARSTRGLVSQAQARRELGLKVFEALERRRHAERARVSTLAFAPSLERSWKVRAVAVAGALLMLSLPGASQSKVAGQISVLHVRTKNWTYLSLNGSPLGYSPVSVPLTPGKTYILEWLSASAHGQKRLLLKAGADLKLTDRDFSH